MATAPPSVARLAERLDEVLGHLPPQQLQAICHHLAVLVLKDSTVDNLPVRDVVTEVFQPSSREQCMEIVRGIKLVEFKNWICRSIWAQGGLEPIVELVRCERAELLQELHRQRRPAILAFSHLGARFAIGPALMKIGVPATMLAKIPDQLSAESVHRFLDRLPGLNYLAVVPGGKEGPAVFLRAVEQLRQGKLVSAAIDGLQAGTAFETTFLGRQLNFRRGIAALARLTGAPVIPIVLAFSAAGWGIDFVIGDPLTGPDPAQTSPEQFEQTLTVQTLRWFEAYLRQHPEQFRTERLAKMRKAPRAAPTPSA